MTISSTTNRNRYEGNGSATSFDFDFYVAKESWLRVVHTDANGNETELVLNTDYTVSGAGDKSGGSITYPKSGSPLPSGEFITLVPDYPYTQTRAWPNQGGFLPETFEDSQDEQAMQIQQLAEQLGRSLLFPVSDSASSTAQLPTSKQRADKQLAFDSDGKPTTTLPSDTTLPVEPYGSPRRNAGNDAWRLDYIVPSVAAIRSGSFPNGDHMWLSGYTGVGTVGGGPLYRDPGDTTTPDNGGTVFVDADGNRWRRYILDGIIKATQFGITPSASDADTRLKAMWEAAEGEPTRIDTNCSVSTKIDLANVSINCEVDEGVEIDCSGLPTGTSLGEQYFLKVSGEVDQFTAVTSDVTAFADIHATPSTTDESSVEVFDSSIFQVGNLVILRSDELFDSSWTGPTSNKRGEMLRVKSVDSANDIVSFHDNIRFSYTATENAKLERVSPISFLWTGGVGIGGGVGEAHSFVVIELAEDVYIDSECTGFEDSGYVLRSVYESRGHVRPKKCTNPGGSVGNRGYGIAFVDGTRYADFTVVGLQCRHVISGGGRLPALDVKARGTAIDCGIESAAVDCHAPCFGWHLDFITRGSQGGAIIRGSDIYINLETHSTQRGLRIKTFATLSSQKNIHFDLKVYGCHGAPLDVDAEHSPIRNISFGHVDLENCEFDMIQIRGDVDGVSGDSIRAKETWNNGRGLRANGDEYSNGAYVKNVRVGTLKIRDTDNAAVDLDYVNGFHVGHIDVSGANNQRAFDVLDSSNVSLLSGKIEHTAGFYPLLTEAASNVSVSCELVTDETLSGSIGWRAIDTSDAAMRDCNRVSAETSGVKFSGSSENVIITGNNFREVNSSTNVDVGSATNVVNANNLS